MFSPRKDVQIDFMWKNFSSMKTIQKVLAGKLNGEEEKLVRSTKRQKYSLKIHKFITSPLWRKHTLARKKKIHGEYHIYPTKHETKGHDQKVLRNQGIADLRFKEGGMQNQIEAVKRYRPRKEMTLTAVWNLNLSL